MARLAVLPHKSAVKSPWRPPGSRRLISANSNHKAVLLPKDGFIPYTEFLHSPYVAMRLLQSVDNIQIRRDTRVGVNVALEVRGKYGRTQILGAHSIRNRDRPERLPFAGAELNLVNHIRMFDSCCQQALPVRQPVERTFSNLSAGYR